MKLNNIKWAAMMALAVVAVGLTSCEDEPDKYEVTDGTPSISYIRPVDVASRDSLLTSASLNSSICIVGKNLRSITSLLFNDIPAVLNTSYMTDNTILLTVPRSVPGRVTDSLYMVTSSNDTVAYPFHVTIPAPEVTALSNEHAKAGEEVTISGDYFLDYEEHPLSVTVGDSYTLPRSAISSISQTEITFTVPDNFPQHENIHVISVYGDTESKIQYMDVRGMLFDFDTPWDGTNVLVATGWHSGPVQSDENSLEGRYLTLGNADLTVDGLSWPSEDNFSFEYWPGTWGNGYTGTGPKLNQVADFTDWTNKALKFEMCIPADNPWTCGPLQIIFSNASVSTSESDGTPWNNDFFHQQGKLSRAIYMPWNNDNNSYDTNGRWVTVTVPFTSFNRDWDGNTLECTFRSIDDFAGLTLFVARGSYNDKTVLPEGKDGHPVIRIDNIRVVPYK